MVKNNKCFVNAHCSYDCPNFDRQFCDEKFGFGIADDIGLSSIDCKNCYYNSGLCKDCLFEYTFYCPREVD